MPDGPTGTDDNPIALDKDVWKLEKTWSALLTGKTWRRYSGRTTHDQYGVVAVLRHRASGHTVRAVSFHLPNHLHNRRTGGPNYANLAGVQAMCDCNVTENRGSALLRASYSG